MTDEKRLPTPAELLDVIAEGIGAGIIDPDDTLKTPEEHTQIVAGICESKGYLAPTIQEIVEAFPAMERAYDREEKKKQSERRYTQLLGELRDALDNLQTTTFEDSPIRYRNALGMIVAIQSRLMREAAEYVGEFPEGMIAELNDLRERHKFLTNRIVEARRTIILEDRERRREPDVVMEGRKCSQCRKKPARVDDLCKVCAREAGTLVHGKIGEG